MVAKDELQNTESMSVKNINDGSINKEKCETSHGTIPIDMERQFKHVAGGNNSSVLIIPSNARKCRIP